MLNAEQFLFEFLDAKRELKMIENRINMIRSDLLPKSPAITGMPGSHSSTDRMADMVAKLDELYQQEEKQRIIAIDKLQIIEELIEKVDKPILKSILYDRYIMGSKWEEVAEHMNYSTQRIYQLRAQALQEFSNILDDCR